MGRAGEGGEVKGQGDGGTGGWARFGVLKEVCVGVVARFPETEQAWGAFPTPRPEGLSFKSSTPGSICLPTPLERNPQQVGDGPHQSQGSQGSRTTKLEFQSGEVKWSRAEGARIDKQGKEAHSKL